MNRTQWMAVVLTTGVGVWLWQRARGADGVAADRGTVIFDNTPIAGPASST